MINDILDLAKIESGKMEVRIEDFSIRDVCEALANLARPIAERKNIDLECRLDEAIPLLRQDPGKLRQILYNLLSNAIKFTPEGGRVTLRAQRRGAVRGARGRGHRDRDRRGRPRDRSSRSSARPAAPGQEDGVLTREHQGTGLGLSIVRELTQAARRRRPPREPARARGARSRSGSRCSCPATASSRSTSPTRRIDLSKARRIEPHAAAAPPRPLAACPCRPGDADPPRPSDEVRRRPDDPRRDRSIDLARPPAADHGIAADRRPGPHRWPLRGSYRHELLEDRLPNRSRRDRRTTSILGSLSPPRRLAARPGPRRLVV